MTTPRLGFLYPGHAAEDDYTVRAAGLLPDVEIDLVHTTVGVDAHRIDDLLDLGGHERLLEGADRFAGPVSVAIWACTSASFVFGWDGARRQADAIAGHLGVPASSTSFAFVEAIQALGPTRVAIAATYPQDVVDAFAAFLTHAGVEVVATGSEDIVTAAEVGTLGRDRVVEFVASGDHPDAEAVLVPDTALHSLEHLAALEAELGKPVLTANQVTLWEALRLAGATRREPTLGALFQLD